MGDTERVDRLLELLAVADRETLDFILADDYSDIRGCGCCMWLPNEVVYDDYVGYKLVTKDD